MSRNDRVAGSSGPPRGHRVDYAFACTDQEDEASRNREQGPAYVLVLVNGTLVAMTAESRSRELE